MDSWWLAAGLGGLFAFLVWLVITRRTVVFLRRAGKPAGPATVPRSAPPPFAYLVFVPGHGCCAGAQAQGGRHYAPGREPALPLAGCNHPRCSCFYDKRPERRIGPRRLTEDRRRAVRYEPHRTDRRQCKGRRAEDDIWAEETES